MDDLSGKVAFVTGAASGIGLGIARTLAAAGARLVLADINGPRLADIGRDLEGRGTEVLTVELNVGDIASWDAARQKTAERFGGVDILCNNAGIAPTRKRLEDISDEDWHWIFDVNVHGVRNGIRTWLPSMRAGGRPGHIVNTASVLGLFAMAESADYVACKFAVVGMSEALHMELAGTAIGVSVLCPGYVRTPLSPDRALHKTLAGLKSHEPPRAQPNHPSALDPDRVGQDVLAAIKAGRFYVLPHPEYVKVVESRFARLRQDFDKCAPTGENLSGLGSDELAWGQKVLS